MRVCFLGMRQPFSLPPFAALLQAGIEVCALIVPARSTAAPALARWQPSGKLSIPVLGSAAAWGIAELATQHAIPVWESSQIAAPELHSLFAELQPELACVACFPQRIPPTLLELAVHGFLNLHPALLPDYRGPAPLFWQLRDGRCDVGVTLHWMDGGLDSGPIALQAPLELAEGISLDQAEQRCAEVGAELLLQALPLLERGALPRRPQPAAGSRQPWPQPADFVLDQSWPARRAFIFLRAAASWGYPLRLRTTAGELSIRAAIGYDEQAVLAMPVQHGQHGLQIQMQPGVLSVRLFESHAADSGATSHRSPV